MDRRDFLRATTVSAMTAALGERAAQAQQAPAPQGGGAQTVPQGAAAQTVPQGAGAQTAQQGGMQYRTLGRTGEKVSIVGLGGFHIGAQKDENESLRIIRSAIDNGITFLDNSWDYNGGESEVRMGKALRDGYRQKVFLMTKIDGRTAQSATDQLEQSLKRLQTDHLDLLQFHEIIRMSDADRVFEPGGALEAMLKAKQAGKLRYIGFTGHKSPEIHRRMLDTAARHGFTFDTVQMPLNVMDAHFDSFERNVLPILVQNNIGVLGMKPMGDQIILKSHAVTPIECLHYTMSLPTSVTITGIDSLPILDQALAAARSFKPLSDQERAALLGKTQKLAATGKFELYKTTQFFDSTAEHPEWLG
jgi:predicted aldo/keto reductase-like oxidoreductase